MATRCFNSRSRVGSDDLPLIDVQQQVGFQFALPRGERPRRAALDEFRAQFQFALPRGERHVRLAVLVAKDEFQFALPRGERRRPMPMSRRMPGFNSRSRVGSDRVSSSVS